tara:strand:- start:1988 stop:2479 length:492 start_codon:yes stop_codon:yes gene_type:complete
MWKKMEKYEKTVNGLTWQELTALGMPKSKAKKKIREIEAQERFKNDLYRCEITNRDDHGWIELCITRHDKQAIHDWRHFQYIKNDIVGPEREALELYPAESRLVDSANSYWLYVAPEGFNLPIGMHHRWVRNPETASKMRSTQRAFEVPVEDTPLPDNAKGIE